MSEDDEFGPWIDHDGLSVPVPVGTVCMIEARCRLRQVIQVHGGFNSLGDCFIWESLPEEWQPAAIIRYRVRKPKGLTILEQIAANPPQEPIGKPVPHLVPA